MTHDMWVDVAGIGLCVVAVGAALVVRWALIRYAPRAFNWVLGRLPPKDDGGDKKA